MKDTYAEVGRIAIRERAEVRKVVRRLDGTSRVRTLVLGVLVLPIIPDLVNPL